MIRAQTVLIACYYIGPLSSCLKSRAILMYLKYQDWKLPFKYFITLEPPQFSESQKNVTSVDGSPQTCPYPVAAANILYFILPLSPFSHTPKLLLLLQLRRLWMMVFVCEDLEIRSTETVNSISERSQSERSGSKRKPGWGIVSLLVSCLTKYERLQNPDDGG